MPDNVYPDLSNDKYDIQYARLLGLSSDLRATFGIVEEGSVKAPGGFPIETPSDVDTGLMRFGVAGEDDTAGENRSFDLNGAYSFALTQLGNNVFLVDPPNGLYQLGAIPVPGSDSGLSYTYLEVNDTTGQITLQAPEGVVLPGYGVGVHIGTPAYSLGVDASGNLIEFIAGVGSGSVTDFIFTDANGFDGTVTLSTTTPTLVLTTTLTQGSVFFAGASGAINEDNTNLFFDNTNNILGIGINSSFTATRLNVVDNSVGAANIVDITSTSTAAAGNVQTGLNVNLSGVNSTGNQYTFGIHSTNVHTGTANNIAIQGNASGGSLNYGVVGTVTGTGTSSGVFGSNTSTGYGVWAAGSTSGIALNADGVTSGYGVYASATSGIGVRGNATTGTGLEGFSSTGISLSAIQNHSSTNTATQMILLRRRLSSGTPADGIGQSIDFAINTSTSADIVSNQIIAKWDTATHASRKSSLSFIGVMAAATVDLLILSGDGSVKLRPITATEASAITPAEGMLVMVSSTNGTFGTVGVYCYENGAWAKL